VTYKRGAHPARAPPKIGKNMIFWRKIAFFHTKYPKNVRASLCSAQFLSEQVQNQKSNIEIVERGNKDSTNIQIHAR
jgi:hypothetical protein